MKKKFLLVFAVFATSLACQSQGASALPTGSGATSLANAAASSDEFTVTEISQTHAKQIRGKNPKAALKAYSEIIEHNPPVNPLSYNSFYLAVKTELSNHYRSYFPTDGRAPQVDHEDSFLPIQSSDSDSIMIGQLSITRYAVDGHKGHQTMYAWDLPRSCIAAVQNNKVIAMKCHLYIASYEVGNHLFFASDLKNGGTLLLDDHLNIVDKLAYNSHPRATIYGRKFEFYYVGQGCWAVSDVNRDVGDGQFRCYTRKISSPFQYKYVSLRSFIGNRLLVYADKIVADITPESCEQLRVPGILYHAYTNNVCEVVSLKALDAQLSEVDLSEIAKKVPTTFDRITDIYGNYYALEAKAKNGASSSVPSNLMRDDGSLVVDIPSEFALTQVYPIGTDGTMFLVDFYRQSWAESDIGLTRIYKLK